MNDIERPTAKEIVRKSLLEVADFSGDFEEFKFEKFQPFHIMIFLSSIKKLVNQTPCHDSSGNITYEEYLDIDLSVNLFKSWEKIAECIDYVANENYNVISPSHKIQLP